MSFIHETLINRTISFTTTSNRKLYLIPIGDHFFDNFTETEVWYDGIIYRLGGFYQHVHRSMPPWMNVRDACIGIILANFPENGKSLILNWKQRINLFSPVSLALVHCTNGAPDYTMYGWAQNDPATAPNAIQVPIPPIPYVVEWWRLSRQKGGYKASGSGYRGGRRYLPVYRGPSHGMQNDALFLQGEFDQASRNAPWRHYKACYYNPSTGARGALCSEVVVSSGNLPDRHNMSGPIRYNLWINR